MVCRFMKYVTILNSLSQTKFLVPGKHGSHYLKFSEDVGGRNRPMKSERPLYISIKGID